MENRRKLVDRRAPSSTTVACIGSGNTVTVPEGTTQAGVLEDKGTVVVSGGSLELANTLEASSAANLSVAGGVLTGAAEVDVSGSFTGTGGGELAGSGSLMIEPGATGTIGSGSPGFYLVERVLRNAGTLTVGKGSGLQAEQHAQLINSGTLVVNGETAGANHGLLARVGEAALTNTGTMEKTEGTGATPIQFGIDNEGAVSTTSGTLEFTRSGAAGEHAVGSWVATGTGSGIVFNSNEHTFALGATASMSGAIEVVAGTVTVGKIEGSAATVTVVGSGVLDVSGSSTSTIATLSMSQGTLTGTAEIDVSGSFTGGGSGELAGTGSVVIESGATGTIGAGSPGFYLVERTLRNLGTLTVGVSSGLQGENHAHLINSGTFILNGQTAAENHGLKAREHDATLTNLGTLKKTAGTGTTPIQFGLENFGSIDAESGQFAIYYPIYVAEPGTSWGGSGNPSAPGEVHSECDDPVSCATGNFTEAQTDLAVAGRGVGLDLARTYNSQAGAAGLHGAFGYGWTSSFSDHLVVEPGGKLATLNQADGSTVPFAEGTGGSFTAPAWTQDTLSGTSEAGYTLTLADQTKYKFAGSSGRLESVTDRNGNATTLAYSEAGRLDSITDPSSRKITLAYNAEGLVESATDPMGHTVQYTYEAGNLATVTLPGEATARWQFKYDGSHEVTAMTNGRGGKTLNEYNAAHQVTSQTDPMARTLTFEYEPFRTVITDAATGSVTSEYFTSNEEPSSITHGSGTASATTQSFTYNAAQLPLSTTDGDGHTTTYGYDSAGDRTSIADATKDETKWTYDATHDVDTTTTPKSETTTITRDSHGNAESVSRPAPGSTTQITQYTYGSHGELASAEDPLKRVSEYGYDAHGDRTSETDPEGNERTREYNQDSQQTATVSPRGNATGAEATKFTTKTERDEQGRPMMVTGPLGHATKYAYDGDGNLEAVTDPNGNRTVYTYDAGDESIKTKEPNGTVTETGYDGAGQVTSQVDGNKHETKYVRNVLGVVTEVVDPLGRKSTKQYDKAGNLETLTDPMGRTTKYMYDAGNRLIEVTYSDGTTPSVKYVYDADGDRTSMLDGTGESTYTYDQLDRLIEAESGHKGLVKYEYDLADEQTKIAYPNTKAVTRAFDRDGRLEKVTDWSGRVTKFTYDPDSDLSATTFPSESKDEDLYTYSDADQMSEVKVTQEAETLSSLLYARDGDGQVEAATSKGLPGEEAVSYEYDANSRLTKGAAVAYEYDAANNPTKIGSGTYKYDSADELESGPSVTYNYDEVGELVKTTPTTGSATTYGYDQAGNLISAERPVEGEKAAINNSYAYDGNGLRASQTMSGATGYLTWNMTEALPLLLSDTTNSYVYGPDGLPVEQVNNTTGAVVYLHHDQAGSIRLITGENGKAEGSYTYDDYGNQTGHTGTATTPLGYDGQYTSPDTGLIYMRARTYDPSTAQFMSRDPLVKLTGVPYGYGGDDPLNYFDPTGLSWQICVGGSVSLGVVSFGGDVCYVSTPRGSGIAVTDSAGAGEGFGANVHVGAGWSNACRPGEYGGVFTHAGGSATYGVGGYGTGFSNAPVPGHGRTVSGATGGVTAGFGAEVGGGPSETAVFSLGGEKSGGTSCGC